ncbi:MAG: DNA alkylation repair protein [Candidatus Methanomethylophilaceae archaeon]|nr:DNA alkylation repair protein [Candidatus Methanomethylophilaceae archaeon]
MIDYRRILKDETEPKYAEFSSKLIPGKEGIMGVRVPKIRALAKRIIKDDWESFLRDEPESFEEEMLRGFVIATAPMDAERRIVYTEGFLDIIDNWSTCDSFCSAWKFQTKDSGRVYGYFAGLMDSGDEYRMRVSLIFRMSHFIDEEHVDDLLEDIASYRHDGYYYKMGAAWAFSFCYIKFPERSMAVLESGRMDDWVFRKSIQKICESYRVSEDDKQTLRSLRKERSQKA